MKQKNDKRQPPDGNCLIIDSIWIILGTMDYSSGFMVV